MERFVLTEMGEDGTALSGQADGPWARRERQPALKLARSTYYDEPGGQSIAEGRLIERIKEICAEWPSYGYRRVTAKLHARGCLVNDKEVMRLMREHGLTMRPRRRFVATTDSTMTGRSFRT